jgi:hypothetical protein
VLVWTRKHFVSKRRLSRDHLHGYGLASLGSKKLRFRSHPEIQIPPFRAACNFPKLERQAGDSISVRVNLGSAVFIHRLH